jgi:hypothetical protein
MIISVIVLTMLLFIGKYYVTKRLRDLGIIFTFNIIILTNHYKVIVYVLILYFLNYNTTIFGLLGTFVMFIIGWIGVRNTANDILSDV